MRVTIDIDGPILRKVKAIHEKEGRSIGKIVSELLAEALARRSARRAQSPFHWTSRAMEPLLVLSDKGSIYTALDADRG